MQRSFAPHLAMLAVALALAACDDPRKPSAPAPSAAASIAALPSSTATSAPPSSTAKAVAAPPAPAAAPASASSLVAANAADVKRFANEKALDAESDTVKTAMFARTAPKKQDGAVIAALRAGAPVVKLAKRGQWFLVTFADPKDKARTLAGWVLDRAFDAASDGDATRGEDDDLLPKCKKDERLLMPEALCAKTCRTNADCPNETMCTATHGKPEVCLKAQVLDDMTL